MLKNTAVITLLGFLVLMCGCGTSSSGTHVVSHDTDHFTETINGRTVEYRDWTIKVDGTEIPIAKKKSAIKIETTASGKVDIFVNGEQVHDE